LAQKGGISLELSGCPENVDIKLTAGYNTALFFEIPKERREVSV
jgi:hypothetical protein